MDIMFKDIIKTIWAEQNGTVASDITRNREKKEAFDGFFDFTRIYAVKESADFSNQTTENLKTMKQARQIIMLQKEEKFMEMVSHIEQMQSSVFEADEMGVPEWCPVKKNDIRKLENEIVQIRNQIDQITKILVGRGVPQMLVSQEKLMMLENDFKKKWEEFGVPQMQHEPDCCLERLEHDFMTKVSIDVKSNYRIENRKQNPSEVAKKIENSDHIEDRRNYLRKEVSSNRRNSQLRAANLNRGLVVDEYFLQNRTDDEKQGASKSDCTFDLTSLDEALPPASHRSKKAPGMKRRALKLQDIIMINMKENRALRLAATASLSLDPAKVEAKS